MLLQQHSQIQQMQTRICAERHVVILAEGQHKFFVLALGVCILPAGTTCGSDATCVETEQISSLQYPCAKQWSLSICACFEPSCT